MATFFTSIEEEHETFIAQQPMFFVATAAADGRVNLSPKGYDVFRVLGPNRVAYLDLRGSGNETHAHLVADGRITIMFNEFGRTARIMRLYGTGRPVLPQDDDWAGLADHFEILPGTRQIFDVTVESVQTSCGYGVPVMEVRQERETLVKYHRNATEEEWFAKVNGATSSIDGLPTRPTEHFFAPDGQG